MLPLARSLIGRNITEWIHANNQKTIAMTNTSIWQLFRAKRSWSGHTNTHFSIKTLNTLLRCSFYGEILIFSNFWGVVLGRFLTFFEKSAIFGPKMADKKSIKSKIQKSEKPKLLAFLWSCFMEIFKEIGGQMKMLSAF